MFRVFLRRTGSSAGQTSSELSLFSHLLGAISSQTSPVSVNGCSGDLVTKLDQSKFFKFRISIAIRFEMFSITDIMHKRCYNVFGRIDFFSVLNYLVVTLGGNLQLGLILTTLELAKISIIFLLVVAKYDPLTIPALYSEANKKCQLDIPKLPILCQELLANCSSVIDYPAKHLLLQEGQRIRKQGMLVKSQGLSVTHSLY